MLATDSFDCLNKTFNFKYAIYVVTYKIYRSKHENPSGGAISSKFLPPLVKIWVHNIVFKASLRK